ncbi:MAG: hypothetical protein LQ349_000095 [Xanthoria aureola]|nr:MAG: hypothetical protein LQ349_000095 [Xanthoria aureola]
MVRVRPGEEQDPQLLKLSLGPRYTISIPSRHKPGKDPPRWTYDVDHIFDQTVGTYNIFDKISPLISAALDGKTLAVIADGQSNAGKSYTMFEGHVAIARQAGWRIFQDIESQETRFINKSRPELRAALEKHACFKRGGSSTKTVTLLHEFLGGDSGVVYLAHVSLLEENLSVTSQTLAYAEDLRKIGRRKTK